MVIREIGKKSSRKNSDLNQNSSGGLLVASNLRLQSIEGIEALFAANELTEYNLQFLFVKVAGEVEEVNFEAKSGGWTGDSGTEA